MEIEIKENINKKRKKWKAIAITFILLSLLELIFILYVWNLGVSMIKGEEECAYEVCDLDESTNYDSYYYDSSEKMCYCFEAGETIKTKYLG